MSTPDTAFTVSGSVAPPNPVPTPMPIALQDAIAAAAAYAQIARDAADAGASPAWGSVTGKPVSITAIASLTPAADRLPYYTGSGAAALATFTAMGRTLASCTDAAAVKTAISAADASHTQAISTVTGLQAALDAKIASALIGVANGVVPLDSGALISSAYLPSYVDDIIEVANHAALPGTGATGKIYVQLDTNTQWRWSGSAWVELVSSPGTSDAVTEGTVNLYHTAARVLAVALTGLSTATNAAITATDTILVALGKLQKQITDAVASISGKAAAGANTDITSLASLTSATASGLVTAGSLKVATGATVLRLVSAYANLDFPSIAAGSNEDLTITVTGALVGDSVALGLGSSPNVNLFFQAFVSATNTVTVRAHNKSASAVNIGAQNFRATVFGF